MAGRGDTGVRLYLHNTDHKNQTTDLAYTLQQANVNTHASQLWHTTETSNVVIESTLLGKHSTKRISCNSEIGERIFPCKFFEQKPEMHCIEHQSSTNLLLILVLFDANMERFIEKVFNFLEVFVIQSDIRRPDRAVNYGIQHKMDYSFFSVWGRIE